MECNDSVDSKLAEIHLFDLSVRALDIHVPGWELSRTLSGGWMIRFGCHAVAAVLEDTLSGVLRTALVKVTS